MKTLIYLSFLIFCSLKISAQKFAISNDKENIFYLGVDNPISFAVEGYPQKSVYLKTDNGKIIKYAGYYYYRGDHIGIAKISVLVKTNGHLKKIGESAFRVKNIPDPVVYVGPQSGGNISKVILGHQQFIRAELENFDIDIHIQIDSFKIIVIKENNLVFNKIYTGSQIVKEVQDAILSLDKDDTVIFNNVLARFPDNRTVPLKPIVFTITDK